MQIRVPELLAVALPATDSVPNSSPFTWTGTSREPPAGGPPPGETPWVIGPPSPSVSSWWRLRAAWRAPVREAAVSARRPSARRRSWSEPTATMASKSCGSREIGPPASSRRLCVVRSGSSPAGSDGFRAHLSHSGGSNSLIRPKECYWGSLGPVVRGRGPGSGQRADHLVGGAGHLGAGPERISPGAGRRGGALRGQRRAATAVSPTTASRPSSPRHVPRSQALGRLSRPRAQGATLRQPQALACAGTLRARSAGKP